MVSLLLSLLAAQDWSRPVEIDRVKLCLPWSLTEGKGAFHLTVFGVDKERSLTLVCHRSTDTGRTWTRVASVALGKLDGPPGVLVRDGRIRLLLIQEKRQLAFRSVDLSSGNLSDARPIAIEGTAKIEDDLWPTLIEHQGALFGLCAESGGRPNRLLLLKSSDDGKSWSLVSDPDWKTHSRHDGMRPLVASAGGQLHLFFNETESLDSISHYASADDGKSWAKRDTTFTGRDPKLFPLAAGTDDTALSVVYGSYGSSKRDAAIHSLVSADGGKSWTRRGDLFETAIDDPTIFCNLSVAGNHAAFFGIRMVPGDKDHSLPPVIRWTEDSGKTWNHPDLSANLRRFNLSPVGTLSRDGKGFLVAFVNVENPAGWLNRWDQEAILLIRRWGAVEAAVVSPLTEEETAQLRSWISQLEDDDIQLREQATEQLVRFGERALPLLATIQSETSDPEVKSRLEEIRKRILPVWWRGE